MNNFIYISLIKAIFSFFFIFNGILQIIVQFQEINCIINTVGPQLTELIFQNTYYLNQKHAICHHNHN